ncbi:centrosome-associated protein Alms1a-like [Periplaneta americana]|uniref:centrosome-associated protein Alms1a-like n=1 Tax=Periplaneta americana TaxID=6978 RepID=UPI0037E72EF7
MDKESCEDDESAEVVMEANKIDVTKKDTCKQVHQNSSQNLSTEDNKRSSAFAKTNLSSYIIEYYNKLRNSGHRASLAENLYPSGASSLPTDLNVHGVSFGMSSSEFFALNKNEQAVDQHGHNAEHNLDTNNLKCNNKEEKDSGNQCILMEDMTFRCFPSGTQEVLGTSYGKEYIPAVRREVNAISDVENTQLPENWQAFRSYRSSLPMSGIQHHTLNMPEQNQEHAVINTEAAGSGRAPSPASVSSVTSSRRLEWDSGADVGYQNYQQDGYKSPSAEGLSTIEKMVLSRGCSAALRLEPEGTSGTIGKSVAGFLQPGPVTKYIFNEGPMAISTPTDIQRSAVVSPTTGTDSESEITPIVKPQTDRNLFPQSSYGNNVSVARNNGQRTLSERNKDFNVLTRQISSSLTNLSSCGLQDTHGDLLSRSQSYLSLTKKHDMKTVRQEATNNPLYLQHQNKKANTCSASSSSIATVVQKHDSPRMLDQVIQTSLFNVPKSHSVGIQVNTQNYTHKLDSGAEIEYSDDDIIDKTETIIEENLSRKQKHKFTLKHFPNNGDLLVKEIKINSDLDTATGRDSAITTKNISVENMENTHSDKTTMQQVNQSEGETEKNCGTLESEASSTQTAASWFMGDASHSAASNHVERCARTSHSVVGAAHSFEYLPGHVYENRNTTTGDSSSESVSSHPSIGLSTKSGANILSNEFWNSTTPSTLATDIEKGVNLLKDLLKSSSYSSKAKKQLVRKVVSRIVETDYAEDKELLNSLHKNVPFVPPTSFVNSTAAVSVCDVQASGTDAQTGETKERLKESASENHSDKCDQFSSHAADQSHRVADKCVGTAFSDTSGPSYISEKILLSDNHSDSRAETTTFTTEGYEDSSSTNTNINKNRHSWKELITQSEKEYEKHKQKSGSHGKKSVLLNLCESERENQLSWISTEIHHLQNLKQLLEKQKNVRTSLIDQWEQSHKGYQKKRRDTKELQKNRDVSPGLMRSVETSSSTTTLTHPRNSSVNDHSHNNKFSELKTCIASEEKRRTGNHKQTSVSDLQISSHLKSVGTQCATNIELCNGKDRSKSSGNIKKLSREIQHKKNVQTHTSDFSNISENELTFELTDSILTDNAASGRINVYTQTSKDKHVTNFHSSARSLTADIENTRNSSKLCACGETAGKYSNSNEENPLCCCKCKKLLTQIKSEIKSQKQQTSGQKAQKEHSCSSNVKNSTRKQNSVSSSRKITQTKDETDSNRSALSSMGTLRDALELTHDSEGYKRVSVATETVENAGVQTSHSVSGLPLIRPHWYPVTQRTTNHTNKDENKINVNNVECPCCGALENDNLQHNVSDGMCSRCMKSGQNYSLRSRKCHNCNYEQHTEENELSSPDNESNYSESAKEKELDNMGSAFDKCSYCRRKPNFEVTKTKESLSDDKTSSTSRHATKSPLGYILTLDESTDTSINSIKEKSPKRSLQEIKMKIAKRKGSSALASGKGQLRSRFNSDTIIKDKEILGKSVKSKNSSEYHKKKRLYRKNLTLQEYLMKNRPDFIQHAEYRRQCIDELAYLRELRQKSKQKLLALASLCDDEASSAVSKEPLPPPPLAVKRVFSQRSMRVQTERKYRKLPEVLSEKVERKKKEDYRTNRLMAQVFAKKLQTRVLKGDVNLSNSKSVISIV